MKCSVCKGMKALSVSFNNRTTISEICPHCHGTGIEPEKKHKATPQDFADTTTRQAEAAGARVLNIDNMGEFSACVVFTQHEWQEFVCALLRGQRD